MNKISGEVLCQCVLYGGCSLVNWTELAVESGIEPKCLLHAAIAYWLKKPLGTNIRSEMSLYVQLLFLITSLLESKILGFVVVVVCLLTIARLCLQQRQISLHNRYERFVIVVGQRPDIHY